MPQYLAQVVDLFTDELDQIRSIFDTCRGHRSVAAFHMPYVPTEDGCLVALWDAWNRFVRELLLLSCAGAIHGLGGTVYTPSRALAPTAALALINGSKKGTRITVVAGEPKWFDVNAISDLTAVLGLSNANVVVNAVTSSSVQLGPFAVANPLEEIRVCRNLVAHKSDGALREVRRVAGGAFSDMTSHVRSRRYGVEVFAEWSDACLALAQAAAQ
jgi:hypothetical protein